MSAPTIPDASMAISLLGSHHQSIDRFGAGLEALQWAPDGTVEALRHRTLPILCVQWHPERLSLPGAADGQLLYDAFLSMAKL